jgi:hypothetical protein
MANPLRWFRRHAKILMVVLGSGAMAIFGLGPVFDAMSRPPRNNEYETKVIAEWKGGEITRKDLDSLRIRHYQTQRFLGELQRQAVATKGDDFRPTVPAIPPIQEGERFREDLVDGQLIDRFMLAEKAKEEGIIVSEAQVDDYIMMASDEAGFSRNDLAAINQEANQGGCSLDSVKRHLQFELLAMQMRLYTFSGQHEVTNPTESIQLYRRVSERISCQTLPVSVEQYIAKIDETPSEAELREIYEAGKFDYEDPTGERPGFKLQNRIKAQYFVAEFETFLQNEMNKLTDEEVQKEYEKLVEEKDDLVMEPVPDAPSETLQIDDPPPSLPGESADGQASEMPADVQPPPGDTEPKDGEQTTKPAGSEKPEEAATKQAESGKPGKEKETSSKENGASERPEKSGNNAGKGGDDANQQSLNVTNTRIAQFVSLTQDPEPQGTGEQTQSGQGSETPDLQEASASEETATDSSETTSDTPEVSGDVVPADQSSEMSATDEIEKRVRPLKDVADEIKRRMARPAAQKAIEEAVKKANAQVWNYHNQRMRWELTEDESKVPEPAPLDVDAIAKECNLIVKVTGLVKGSEFVEDPLGRTAIPRSVQMPDGTRQMRFSSVADSVFSNFDNIKLYDPMQANDFMTSNNYVYWLIEKADTKVPEFEACRPEVEKFWKAGKALEMAEEEAQKIADRVNQQDQLLNELYSERATETGEFSWFNSFQGASYGNPVGVELPGEEFMETAFSLDKGKAGVAPNRTRKTVYVIQMVSDRKKIEEIGDDYIANQFFKFKQIPADVRGVAGLYRQELVYDWNREFVDDMGLKYMGR